MQMSPRVCIFTDNEQEWCVLYSHLLRSSLRNRSLPDRWSPAQRRRNIWSMPLSAASAGSLLKVGRLCTPLKSLPCGKSKLSWNSARRSFHHSHERGLNIAESRQIFTFITWLERQQLKTATMNKTKKKKKTVRKLLSLKGEYSYSSRQHSRPA